MAIYKIISGASSYKVGDDGTVWSKKKSNNWRKLKPRLVGGGRNRKKNGRPSVHIYMDNGTTREYQIHQLVAEYHLGPRPPDILVLHKDDNRWNNTASNIYYGSQKQNHYDKGDNGITPLSRTDVLAIRASNLGCTALGRQYGVDRKTIWSIKTYRTWTDI